MMAQLPDWPTFGLGDDVRPALAQTVAAGEAAVLITLERESGGAPRPEGSQMLVSDAALSGFLSGGCVEGDLLVHARRCLQDGAPRQLVYGEGSPFPDIRLLCGARIEVFMERVDAGDAAAADLLALAERRVSAFWATDGVRRACAAEPPSAPAPWRFVRRHDPRPRLAVVGADPIALAIAALAEAMAFETHLIRPRGPSEPPPIPGVIYHRGAPDRTLETLSPDPWTYVAVATHDLETDEAALLAALASPIAYVGVLGARRRIGERKARLVARGASAESLERLHAPIGLDLGGKAPFEIAVAVMADITLTRHRSTAPLLRRGLPSGSAADLAVEAAPVAAV